MRSRFIGVGALLVGAQALSAQTLIDNLSEPTRAATIIGGPKPDAIWAAQSFSTPTAYTLVSIDALLGNRLGEPAPVLELRQGDTPAGPAVATFTLTVIPEGVLDATTLLPDVVVLLQPGELYWIVMGMPDTKSGSFEWAYARGNEWSGPGTLGAYSYSADGLDWPAAGTDNPYQVRISVASDDCSADFNADGAVNSQDFFDFLVAFFAAAPEADFNLDSTINSQDFFDFLTAFFAGC